MKIQRLLGTSLLLVLVLGTSGLLAQGVQTATLVGSVTGPEGDPLPGVTVTATSPVLMGERQTWTASNGDYIIRGLPPGMYTVRFSLDGMRRVESKAALSLGNPGRVDASMQMAATAEAITVTAEAPAVLETTTVGANLTSETIGKLPAGRTVAAIAALAGGVSDSAAPVAGQVQINGGMAYDNAMLVNGVNIQDPIFGQIGAANSLFIEGAIAETQVLTSGISAEYGQFTGGVVNVVTKSGGNDFSGSVRLNMSKPDWRDETPFEKDRGIKRTGDRNEFTELTLGGPILVDRAWFFLAGRDQEGNFPQTLGLTGQVADQLETNRRYEVKLSGALTPRHNLQASYSDNPTERNLELQVSPRELAALARDSQRENSGYVVNYTGVLTDKFFAEARYSEKKFKFINTGGWLTNIEDSPHRHFGLLPGTAAGGGTFVAPYFDSTDPEDRDNKQMYAALSYFWAPRRFGSHDIKVGAERFSVIRTGGNSQSATGYVFSTDYKAAGGAPVLDSSGRMIPVYTSSPVGGTPYTRLTQWIPTRGAALDITTDSFFFNDRWNLNTQWSFSLGIRHEQTTSEATGGIVGVDTTTTDPRIGVMFDPFRDGRFKFDATYGRYSGRYNPSIIGRNTPVGNPASITMQYIGPSGEGRAFAPAMDINNYVVTGISVPGKNLFFEDGLAAPVNEEWSLSGGMALPRGGFLKLTYVDRNLLRLVDDFITFDLGTTTLSLAGRTLTVDNVLYRNTDDPQRKYQGAQLQGSYRLTRNWAVEGNYTYQIKNDGNYEGEGGQSIGATIFGDRPEMQSTFGRNNPTGRLDEFQRHRVRFWSTYDWDLGRAGSLGTGVMWRYDSALTFSYSTTTGLSQIQRDRNPGYKQPPTTQTLFFGDRGAGEFNATSLFDLALNYRIPVWKSLSPWIKVDVYNLLNDDTLRTFDTTVAVDNTSALDADGLRTGFTTGTNFGKATSAAHYVVPREYLFAVGLTF
jgi:hypothetical protein